MSRVWIVSSYITPFLLAFVSILSLITIELYQLSVTEFYIFNFAIQWGKKRWVGFDYWSKVKFANEEQWFDKLWYACFFRHCLLVIEYQWSFLQYEQTHAIRFVFIYRYKTM